MLLPGAGLQCLKDSRANLQSQECKQAVTELIASTSEDARLDPILKRVCADEIKSCIAAGVSPKEGRLNECLRQVIQSRGDTSVNKACKQQVLKIVAHEVDDVRMSYPLQSRCKSELHELCGNVDPSKAQGLVCLQSHMRSANFGAPCFKQVVATLRLVNQHHHLVPKVATTCADEIDAHCAQHKGDGGDGAVLNCLLANEMGGNLTKSCGIAIRNAGRSAFLAFDWGQGMSRVCDADIFAKCAGHGSNTITPYTREVVDVNQDGVYEGSELWPCIARAAHSDDEQFFDPGCRDLIQLLSLDPEVPVEDAKAYTKKLRKELQETLKSHAAMKKQAAAARDSSSADSATVKQAVAEMDGMREAVRSKGEELSRLRDQLDFQMAMTARNRKLLEESQSALMSGMLISWRMLAPLALVALAVAGVGVARCRASPGRKGYEVLVVPKDG